MSRRRRAAVFATLAAACAIASASIASGYRSSVDDQLGPLRPVVVVARGLDAHQTIERKQLGRLLEVRQIPERFVPPDALADPRAALGRRTLAPVPAGSYLLASHLASPASGNGGGAGRPRLGAGLRPIEIAVSGAAALSATGRSTAGMRVDVVVASEPGIGTGGGHVRIAAEGVRLLGLRQAPAGAAAAAGAEAWNATLAVSRAQALDLIEAENFAREIRLIPRR